MKKSEKAQLFRKPFNLIIALAPLFFFGSLDSWQCKCNKQGKVVMNKPVKAPVAISFIDANRLLSIQIPNVKVTLIDEDRQVVTPNNLSFSTLELKGGVMTLALKADARIGNTSPYRFAIKAEAPGYITNYRTIVVTENRAQYIPVFMVKIDDPPTGMAGFAGNIPILSSTINSNITIIPNATNQQKRKVSVRFTQGTILLNKGKRLSEDAKNVTYNFSFASPVSRNALRTFPGGPLITDAVDSNNVIATPKEPFLFTSAGWMTLEMKAKDEEVTEFSNPAFLSLPIDDSLLNPITSKPYKVGDKIDIWSLNNRSVWRKEGNVIVTSSNDGLIATVSIKHLSTWNLDFKTNACASTTINYNNTTGSTVIAYSEVVSTQNGMPFMAFGPNPLTFTPGMGSHTIIRGPNNVGAAFLVYDNSSAPGPIRASSSFTFCSGPTPPTLNITSSMPQSKILDFVMRDQSTEYPICNNAVFFLDDALFIAGNNLNYGDNLVIDGTGKLGTATLYQNISFSTTHIRLFYGGLSGGMTISQTVDFTVDLSDLAPTAHSAIGTTITGVPSPIDVQYFLNGNGHYKIIIPYGTNGVSPISSCL